MLLIGVVFAALLYSAKASLIPDHKSAQVDVTPEFLETSLNVLRVFNNAFQSIPVAALKKIADTYDVGANADKYTNQECVVEFLSFLDGGQFLPEGKTFSVLNPEHTRQVEVIVNLMFVAKDMKTVVDTALFCREHLNRAMSLHCFTVAILLRSDTVGIPLPSPFEVNPYFYITRDILEESKQEYQNNGGKNDKKEKKPKKEKKTKQSREESDVSFLTEDPGLCGYFMMTNLVTPFWVMGHPLYQNQTDREGELFWYKLEYIERRIRWARMELGFSSKTTKLEDECPAYNPKLYYMNGEVMPARGSGLKVTDKKLLQTVQKMAYAAKKISVAGGYKGEKGEFVPLDDSNGANALGNMIGGYSTFLDSDTKASLFYSTIELYSEVNHTAGEPPCALAHFPTMMRDPLFHRAVEQVVCDPMNDYKKSRKQYSLTELGCLGVSVEGLTVTPLKTSFATLPVNLHNALVMESEEDAADADIEMSVLNHTEYEYSFNVTSKEPLTVMARVFLMPMRDEKGKEMKPSDAASFAVEIDRFPFNLEAGERKITRKSADSTMTCQDFPPVKDILDKLLAMKGSDDEEGIQGDFSRERQCGFPHRLLLPKGSDTGMPVQLLVVVNKLEGVTLLPDTDASPYKGFATCGAPAGMKFPDDKAMMFPFDRPQIKKEFFFLPNVDMISTVITHT